MRILTPSEQREIEALRNSILKGDIEFIVCKNWYEHEEDTQFNVYGKGEHRDMWLNALEMVLQTQEALKTEWYRRGNNKIDTIQAVEYKRNDNE